MEKTGCKVICGAPTTLAVKGLMMMMMIRTIFQEMYIAGGESTILQEMYKNDISGDVYCRWCEYNIAGDV